MTFGVARPAVNWLQAKPSQLWQQLQRVRRDGFATNFSEREVGVSAIGACVRDPAGQPLAAVAVAAPASGLPGMAEPGTWCSRCSAVAFIERLFRDEQARLARGNAGGEHAPP